MIRLEKAAEQKSRIRPPPLPPPPLFIHNTAPSSSLPLPPFQYTIKFIHTLPQHISLLLFSRLATSASFSMSSSWLCRFSSSSQWSSFPSLLFHRMLLILSHIHIIYPSSAPFIYNSWRSGREKAGDPSAPEATHPETLLTLRWCRPQLLLSLLRFFNLLPSQQIRRVAFSVPSNVWSGTSSTSPRESLGLLRTSRSELESLESWTWFLRPQKRNFNISVTCSASIMKKATLSDC